VTGTVFFGLRPSTFGCIVVLPTAASVALLMSLLSRHFCAAHLALFAATASGGLALAAEILSCAQFTHEGAPQPMARGDQRGLERLDRINQAVKNTPYSALFLGDSLTEGWDPVLSERSLEVDPDRETAGAASQGVSLPVSMSAPIAVGATAGLTSLRFTSSISNPLLVVVPVGMWAKASISPLSELAREAGEAQPVGNADRPHIHRPFW